MIKECMQEIIKERIRNCDELGGNWDYGIEKCNEQMISILTDNIEDSITYILNECSNEDFFWISEVFIDLIKITKSTKLLDTFKTRLSYVNEKNYNQNDFKSKFARENCDFKFFIESIEDEINYASFYCEESKNNA